MNKFLIIATSRVIKLVANITKLLNYLVIWVFPKKRFKLPPYAAPLLNTKKLSKVPRVIWQTNFTDKVTLPVYLNYLFNRLMSPSYEYRFMITEARSEFIKNEFPDVFPYYDRLKIGAAQADLWRLLILYKFGGVYLDIDAHQVWPLASIVGQNREELYVMTRRGEISNYFIASKPDNENIKLLIDKVVENISLNSSDNIFHLTGPGVFNECLDKEVIPTVLYRYAVNQGSFTNEYFQYIDKPQGKWNKEQEKTSILK
ncbi:MAG: glycosyl transferase [Halomonas sp.]|nr:glycosyl transferase [Halomonas sp.]